jgi:hypothetical protein
MTYLYPPIPRYGSEGFTLWKAQLAMTPNDPVAVDILLAIGRRFINNDGTLHLRGVCWCFWQPGPDGKPTHTPPCLAAKAYVGQPFTIP